MLYGSEIFVEEVHSHLCSKGIIGDVREWCEMRHDCVYVVTCPDCGETFALQEEEYDLLIERSRETAPVCGISPTIQ
jgi:hypothetical protein